MNDGLNVMECLKMLQDMNFKGKYRRKLDDSGAFKRLVELAFKGESHKAPRVVLLRGGETDMLSFDCHNEEVEYYDPMNLLGTNGGSNSFEGRKRIEFTLANCKLKKI